MPAVPSGLTSRWDCHLTQERQLSSWPYHILTHHKTDVYDLQLDKITSYSLHKVFLLWWEFQIRNDHPKSGHILHLGLRQLPKSPKPSSCKINRFKYIYLQVHNHYIHRYKKQILNSHTQNSKCSMLVALWQHVYLLFVGQGYQSCRVFHWWSQFLLPLEPPQFVPTTTRWRQNWDEYPLIIHSTTTFAKLLVQLLHCIPCLLCTSGNGKYKHTQLILVFL